MNQADFQQLTVGVQGMTCASCVGRVERSLRKLDGVLDASVNLATEKATVTLDGAKVQAGSVLATIEGSGYTPVTAHASLAVRGMTCANCVARVERTLNKLDGVVEANVNLATEKATVTYLPDAATLGTLKNAIRGAGYEVLEEAAGKEQVDAEREAREQEVRKLRRRLTIAAVFTAPLILLVMIPMLIPGLEAALMRVVPMQTIFYISFLLATVVQFGPGLQFMRSGWKALSSGSRSEERRVGEECRARGGRCS